MTTSYPRAIALFTAGTVVILAGFELGARYVLPHVSKTQARLVKETQAARTVKTAPGHTHVLAIGNSITVYGLDTKAMQAKLPDNITVTRLAIEDTIGFDWSLWIRRLADEGVQTDAVLIGLRPRMLLHRERYRGPLGAHYLTRTTDFPEVFERTDAHPTTMVSFLFSHVSRYEAMRQDVTKVLFTQLLPNFPRLAASLRGGDASLPDEAKFKAPLEAEVKDLARHAKEALGARLILWIPPAKSEPLAGLTALQDAARPHGVPVLIPIADDAIDEDAFTDGLHLTAEGAATTSAALAPLLVQALQASR